MSSPPQDPVETRPYVSPKRDAASEALRQRLLAAALDLLRTNGGAGFTLEAVAKAAGVTRLTVHNQFGSRRALLEATFDHGARAGGMDEIREAMAMPDAEAALRRVVEIFCRFWSGYVAGIEPLLASGGADPEFRAAMRQRDERRRKLMAVLAGRLAATGRLRAEKVATFTDLAFATTSMRFFSDLLGGGHDADATTALVVHAVALLLSDAAA